jgi:sarcosine oxidase subunit beta
MPSTFDTIIIGGGVIGLSAAYHLSKRGLTVVVLDKNFPGSGSTTRCIGGIRQQFSTEASIRLMQESVKQFKQMEQEFGFSVEFYQGGYLFLAYSQANLDSFKTVSRLQKSLGLDIRLLSVQECLEIVPCLNPDKLMGGVYSPDDGQAYPFKVIAGFIQEIRKARSIIRSFVNVTGMITEGQRIKGVVLKDGEKIYGNTVLNAAGPWAAEVSQMAGVPVPILPEKHQAFITDRQEKLFETMIVDYRTDGCYFQQLINGQIIGCYTPIPNQPGTETGSSKEFLLEMSKRTVRLIPDLIKARVLRHWGGSYSMTPDGSPIIDKTDIAGYYVAAGMSGHGFMFSPAIGKYISDIIIDNQYPFDWNEFKLNRDFSGSELMK